MSDGSPQPAGGEAAPDLDAQALAGGPAAPAPAPTPEAGPVLAPGMAKALEALEAGLDPGVAHDKGWVRAVRIAGRRLRTLLRGLAAPGDPAGLAPLRDALRVELDALSEARDAEVVRKWLGREDVAWDPDEAVLAARVAPAAPPAGEAAGLRVEVGTRLAPVVAAVRARIRAELPEELHRPLPEGFPGVVLGEPPPDRLPPWRQLRAAPLAPRARRAARVFLDGVASPLEAWMPALAPDVPETEDLHELRRAGRRVRYLLEALRVVVAGLDEVRAGVKHFQWLLGQVNDRRLVADLLDAQAPAELGEAEGRGLEKLRRRLAAEEAEILAEARQLVAGPASPEALARARRAVFSPGAA